MAAGEEIEDEATTTYLRHLLLIVWKEFSNGKVFHLVPNETFYN